MIEKTELSRIKEKLEGNIGNKVRLTAKKGRKKTVTRLGVLESTHPSIFIIKLDSAYAQYNEGRRVSYSYTDILTKTVELVVFKQKTDVACS